MIRSVATSVMILSIWLAAAWAGEAPTTAPAERGLTPLDTPGPRAETPSTRPAKVDRSPLPPAEVRRNAVDLGAKDRNGKTRRSTDVTPPATAKDPARPNRPAQATRPRYAVPTYPDYWLPLATLQRLRPESPVRAHEPVLDPMGSTELNVLPIWRTKPAAAHRAQIPDPYENLVPLSTQMADEDPPATTPGRPGKVSLSLDAIPATQPAGPATQPVKG